MKKWVPLTTIKWSGGPKKGGLVKITTPAAPKGCGKVMFLHLSEVYPLGGGGGAGCHNALQHYPQCNGSGAREGYIMSRSCLGGGESRIT